MTSRWNGLDGLRGVAVVAVVLFHVGIAPEGFLGVDVFFVLSGFLITKLLVNEHRKTGRIRLARFTARRLLRLYPALAAVCLFCVGLAVLSGREVEAMVHDAVLSLLYVSNLFPMQLGLLGHTWTLSLEEQFYLVWPALLLFRLRSAGRLAWAPAFAVLASVLVVGAISDDPALHTYIRAMGLPLGCALALASPRVTAALARIGNVSLAVFVLIIFVPLPDWMTVGWPASIGAILAVPMVARAVSRPLPPLSTPTLRWLGLRSYSLYLWHLPIISLMLFQFPGTMPMWLRSSFGILLSLGAAELSYRFIEQPFLRLRDRRAPAPTEDPGPDEVGQVPADHRPT